MSSLQQGEKEIAARWRQVTLACAREHKGSWVVLQRKCNFSAFSGYRQTPSDYSALQCQAHGCGRVWRTKAAYVDQLPDGDFVQVTR